MRLVLHAREGTPASAVRDTLLAVERHPGNDVVRVVTPEGRTFDLSPARRCDAFDPDLAAELHAVGLDVVERAPCP